MVAVITSNKSIDGGLRPGISWISPALDRLPCSSSSSKKNRATEREGTRHSSLFAATSGSQCDRGEARPIGEKSKCARDRTTHIAHLPLLLQLNIRCTRLARSPTARTPTAAFTQQQQKALFPSDCKKKTRKQVNLSAIIYILWDCAVTIVTVEFL